MDDNRSNGLLLDGHVKFKERSVCIYRTPCNQPQLSQTNMNFCSKPNNLADDANNLQRVRGKSQDGMDTRFISAWHMHKDLRE